MDVVVFVEPSADAPPWGPRETTAERLRIQRAVGLPPVRTDLWIRTVDQRAEAERIVGGVEWLCATEGVSLYSRELARAPVCRRAPAEVLYGNVRSWLSDASTALRRADLTMAGGCMLDKPARVQQLAMKAARCAINAVLVRNSIPSAKRDTSDHLLRLLRGCEPAIAMRAESAFRGAVLDLEEVRSLLRAIAGRLASEARLRPVLHDIVARLG